MLSGSKLQKSAVRGASFKFARAALFRFSRSHGSGFRLTRRGTCGLRPQRRSPRFARVRLSLCVISDTYLPVREAINAMNEKYVTPSYWVLFIALPAIIAGVIVITFKIPLWLWAVFIVLLLIVGEHGLKKWVRFLSHKNRTQ